MDTSATLAGMGAAELQRLHDLEATADSSSALAGDEVTPVDKSLDTNDHGAFPSLASSTTAAPRPVKPTAWGADSGPRIKATHRSQPIVSDSFTLSAIELPPNKDGKPSSLGEIMKQVMSKFKVKIEASANQKTRQTTFHMKSESQRELDKAKRNLLALLSPVVTLTLSAPASTIPAIIGPRGANLKHVREQTGVKVEIPRRESVTNGHLNGSPSGIATPTDEEDEVLVPITITGPQPLVHEARAMLNETILARTSKSTQRVKNIPNHVFPFVTARRALFVEGTQDGDIHLAFNPSECEAVVSGDREVVVRVVETIQETIESLKSDLISVKISLPKRQHRLLTGEALDEIMERSQCSVVVPEAHVQGEEVLVYGKQEDISAGLGAVMEKANSQYIHEFPLPGPIAVSRQLLTYITRINYPRTLSAAHPGVSVFTPSDTAINEASVLNIDIVGEKSLVDGVIRQVSELLGKLIGATKVVSIDWLIHRVIIGKHAKKLKQFHEVQNVQVIFPPESAERSSVLLVYDPFSPAASPSPVDKEKHLNDVSEELLKISKDVADVKNELIYVDKRWHEAVVGIDGTTLNAIIGEDKALSIKVGAEVGDPSGEDVILVRGVSVDVDRAVKEILRVVEDAKNDAIVSSFSTEFEIDREYVGRIVGALGAGVNRLRDQLGVRVDVSDEAEEKDKERDYGKKKKPVHLKSKIKITGRKENVEEAKRRILTQVERLADEASETLKIPAEYHSSLIGHNGKYAIRLEEKYGVKITFPRGSSENGENRTRETLKPDEVLVKGGKKGVAGAKSELLDALEFEKESNKVLQFTVPTRAVARILGRGGASINQIKDDTGAQIDIDRGTDDNAVTNISARGTKEAIDGAKTAILAIVEQLGEETTASLAIETKFHRVIIGPGGQGLKDLITRCGGPTDSKSQAGLVRFPRQGEPTDEVRLRGEPALVGRIKVELEKTVATLRDRVVLAVEIPAAQHRNLIGRGGQHLTELQTRTGVQVQFPGSRSYYQVGEVINPDEIKDADPADVVKVSGSRSACEAAIDELKGRVQRVYTPVELLTAVVSVPLKYHHAVSQQGNFFRNLRSYGVHVEQSAYPQRFGLPTPPQNAASTARIDDTEDEILESNWQVGPNYEDAEEGDSEWTLKAKDTESLERAQNDLKAAIEQAEAMTHVGFLTLTDRSVFPRIVGTKGANVARLRAETGADINVSRDSNVIVIVGPESAVEHAREAILQQATSLPRRRPG